MNFFFFLEVCEGDGVLRTSSGGCKGKTRELGGSRHYRLLLSVPVEGGRPVLSRLVLLIRKRQVELDLG